MTPEKTVRVLVADDDEAIRKLVANVLQGSGYGILQAADGQKAIDLFCSRNKSNSC